ncbi:MAG: 50S ribosomal protein L6 [Bacteroidetes bacterium]|nr:50S ribosomal protein L6 [Bacteroidota bacterium]
MSRVGNSPIALPDKVELSVDKANKVTVKGPNGELVQTIDPAISIKAENGEILIERSTEQKRHKAMHGLYRSLIANMIEGVSKGFKTQQEFVGVGYKVNVNGQLIEMALGFSHDIYFKLPNEIKATAVTDKGKAPVLTLESHDKQLLGQVAAKIRSFRKPEPYKGKGIKFVGEQIRRKAGKSASK